QDQLHRRCCTAAITITFVVIRERVLQAKRVARNTCPGTPTCCRQVQRTRVNALPQPQQFSDAQPQILNEDSEVIKRFSCHAWTASATGSQNSLRSCGPLIAPDSASTWLDMGSSRKFENCQTSSDVAAPVSSSASVTGAQAMGMEIT